MRSQGSGHCQRGKDFGLVLCQELREKIQQVGVVAVYNSKPHKLLRGEVRMQCIEKRQKTFNMSFTSPGASRGVEVSKIETGGKNCWVDRGKNFQQQAHSGRWWEEKKRTGAR